MNSKALIQDLEQALAEVPILDIHTHLVGGKLAAQGLHDVLLYHMVVSDLYAAGCPSGRRPTEYPEFPTDKEAHDRIQEALPFLSRIQNTSSSWAVRIILSDLYDWHEPITAENWRRLDAMIRERANDRCWQHSILDLSTFAAPGRKLPGEETGKMTIVCNMPSNGGSSPAANGGNSTRRFTNWSGAGGILQKVLLHPLSPAAGRQPGEGSPR